MRLPMIKILFFGLAFVLLVGMACQIGGSDPTATPVIPREEVEDPEQPPTDTDVPEPEPTDTQTPTSTATDTPTATPTETVEIEQVEIEQPEEEAQAFFTEEFDGDMDSWSYFLTNGSENDMDLYADVDSLVFDLRGENQWVYVIYDEFTYSNVKIEVLAENKGMNSNNVSLICNYTDRYGWYEFNITNGGLYYILAYSEIDGEYNTLATGGSTNVRTGRNSNVYTAICQENELALYVNGVLEKRHTDNIYNFSEGQVGVSVASFNILPILVEIQYFDISVP